MPYVPFVTLCMLFKVRIVNTFYYQTLFRGDLGKNAKTAVCASGPLLRKEHTSSSLYFSSAVKRSVVKPTAVSDTAGLLPHTRYLFFFPENSVLVR